MGRRAQKLNFNPVAFYTHAPLGGGSREKLLHVLYQSPQRCLAPIHNLGLIFHSKTQVMVIK